ncbi:protein NO VEIN domain-containing protein [Streptomyces sp. NPDC002623]
MRLLPSHGLAFSTLLLAHAAVRAPRTDVDAWAHAAADHAPHWARSLDLRATARALLLHDLAQPTDTGVQTAEQLHAVALQESGALQAAARVLLTTSPPAWLALAVRSGTVVRDYIPAADLRALAWLEPDLDALLLDAAAQQRWADEEAWRERLGAAAEAAVLSALRRAGRDAVQVSLVSDAYGYDIEVRDPPVGQIEVKGAGPETRGTFHITRHEFETSQRRPDTWRLMQVVFQSSAFSADVLGAGHIAEVLQLTPRALREVVPEDTRAFVWEQSALLTPPATAWRPADLTPSADFSAAGLRRQALPSQRARR